VDAPVADDQLVVRRSRYSGANESSYRQGQ
jgi:hypothetical protein